MACGLAQALFQPGADRDEDERPEDDDDEQGPGDQRDGQAHEDDERHVGQGDEVMRGEEVAGSGKVAVVRLEACHQPGLRAGGSVGAEQGREELPIDAFVENLRQALDLAGAQVADGEFGGKAQQGADGQGPEGLEHPVEHHLVVHQHGEERENQHSEVDQQAGDGQAGETAAQQPCRCAPVAGGDGVWRVPRGVSDGEQVARRSGVGEVRGGGLRGGVQLLPAAHGAALPEGPAARVAPEPEAVPGLLGDGIAGAPSPVGAVFGDRVPGAAQGVVGVDQGLRAPFGGVDGCDQFAQRAAQPGGCLDALGAELRAQAVGEGRGGLAHGANWMLSLATAFWLLARSPALA